ncbi:MAG: GxxExxY protein [Chitinophagaceae bacterium]|nr:GxxExxY protein [Chitinophagaceae bacterium]MBL0056029.1 GxxExxY protein [Chitinophagaceae bacterium]
MDNYKHSDITGKIIKAYYNVYNQLGYGFLEKVYENSLLIELQKFDLECHAQCPIQVFYDETKVGIYIADIIVNNCVIIEVKAAEVIAEEHEAQLTNYLRATDIEVGILLNFGKKPDFKRKVFSAEFKNLKKSSYP